MTFGSKGTVRFRNSFICIISKKLRYFNIPTQEFQKYLEQIKLKYTTGIKSLNKNQLKNLISNLGSGRVDKTAVKSRLNFYEIAKLLMIFDYLFWPVKDYKSNKMFF